MLGPFAIRCRFIPSHVLPPGLPIVDVTPSPAVAMQLALLSTVPYGPAWAGFLNGFDIFPLFKLSLYSLAVFGKVMEHVRANSGDSCHTDELAACGPEDFMGNVPVDIFFLILQCLPLLDRYHLGRTSRKYHALHLREFQASVNRLLRDFGLCHSEVRFMQSALWVMISGSAITRLVLAAGTPDNIDFYSPRDAYPWLVRFIEVATSYQLRGSSGPVVALEGTLDYMEWVCRPTQRTLKLICSTSDNAMDCTTKFPSSHSRAMLSHFGLWIGHAKTTTMALTMPNRPQLAACGTGGRTALADIVRKYMQRGYKFVAERSGPHICGSDYECPATLRTSIDGGCMNLFFPSLPYLAAPQPTGSVCKDSLQCHPANSPPIGLPLTPTDISWRATFDALVDYATTSKAAQLPTLRWHCY
ncbi:hypothetical protein DFH06DRAFT_1135699 [Mycena polygramma]|nr:hypothetical protein DFH06DRAFT_1135699 [Mycena polygramma]